MNNYINIKFKQDSEFKNNSKRKSISNKKILITVKSQPTYHIPYSKKTVDEIISKSAPVNKQDIRFIIKFASADCPSGPRIDTRS